MYEARASASENMHRMMRTLEAGKVLCRMAGIQNVFRKVVFLIMYEVKRFLKRRGFSKKEAKQHTFLLRRADAQQCYESFHLFSRLPHAPENDSRDLSVLMECRRSRSLLLIRDRTERERDALRAACRRRREEAAVRDNILNMGEAT